MVNPYTTQPQFDAIAVYYWISGLIFSRFAIRIVLSSKIYPFLSCPIRNSTCTPKIVTWACHHRKTSRCLATRHVLLSHGQQHRLGWKSFQSKAKAATRPCKLTTENFVTFLLDSVADIFLASFTCWVELGNDPAFLLQGNQVHQFIVCLFVSAFQRHIYNLDLLVRFIIFRICFNFTYGVCNVHSFGNTPEYSVLIVQPRLS